MTRIFCVLKVINFRDSVDGLLSSVIDKLMFPKCIAPYNAISNNSIYDDEFLPKCLEWRFFCNKKINGDCAFHDEAPVIYAEKIHIYFFTYEKMCY
ncbi:hypothetical protein OUZ56_011958 [Daphnia magna]|uniref:Uncharacterized protein n=1 Tax=Daphnia magna TaxID=35525 RepID=A0ABQ9Z1Y1_9CRUS|nr:hypothetical protein OUZ56_011958 [Daphnia magna]